MSGPNPPVTLPPSDHHIGSLVMLFRSQGPMVIEVIDRHLLQSHACNGHDTFLVAARTASIMLESPLGDRWRAELLAFVLHTNGLEEAALRVEQILRSAEHFCRQADLSLVRAGELNVFLTAKVTERFLGEARHPDDYSLRKVANNLLNAVSTAER
ncbi:MAG: hypothetical protein QG626_537 [Patescibacteria group bacterium]|jgi:hypothetical protein|nr:hypothetical protein [Patescibacteria group bacterium]